MIATRQRISEVAATSQFVANKNRRRALIALGLFAVILVLFGVRTVLGGIANFMLSAPALAIQLGFALAFGILQFAGIMWFLSRPRRYTIKPDDPQIGMSFDNYRGQPDLLEHAQSTVRILQGVKEFELRGGEMPKGMLLSGAPGTGKTFLAAVIAAEANLPFIYIDASSLRGMFWGMTEMMILKLFRDARGLARRYAKSGQRGACIIFMDEIDSIGMNRGGQGGVGMMGGMMMGGGTGLNTLLNQMDSLTDLVEDRWRYKVLRWFGFVRGPVRNKPLVFVIGATNRPAVLDPALIRPGRLDRMIEVHVPDADGRRDIIQHYLAQKAHEPEIPIDLMLADSIGWTPIEIKTIINEALIHAHDAGREQLSYKDWLAAADERSLGLKQPIRKMSPEDRRAIAYHEAGHAVAGFYLRPEDRILKASIIRRGGTLGVVQDRPREERYTLHARQIETDIMMFLGSRAVEEDILETKMSGAGSDLFQASRLALVYCAQLGMGSSLLVVPASGPLSYPMPVAQMADQLLEHLMAETKRLMKEKAFAVHAVAAALEEHGELIGSELEEVFERAEAENAASSKPFKRKLFTLPRLFKDPNAVASGGTWPAQEQPAAEAASGDEAAAQRLPHAVVPSWPTGDPTDQPIHLSATWPGSGSSYTS
jgi:cell division protease FtsH